MKIILAVFLSSIFCVWCSGQVVLSDNFPQFSSEATIQEVSLAPDGGVFIRGDFNAIDGVFRPGLAKLRADGSLDSQFAPLEEAGSLFLDQFGDQIFSGFIAQNPTLFPLSNGNLIWSDFHGHWLRDPSGQLIPNSFAGFDLGIEEEPEPQFERAGEVCLVIRRTSLPNEIAFADPQDGSHLRTLSLPEEFSLYQTLQVGPAADGKLWVIRSLLPTYTGSGFRGSASLHLTNRLCRLLPTGELDPDFTEVSLLSNRFCTLERASSSQVVVSYAAENFFFLPNSAPNSRTVEFRNAEGEVTSSIVIGLNTQELFSYALHEDQAFTLRSYPLQIFSGASLELTPFFEGDGFDFSVGEHSLTALSEGCLLVGGTRKITAGGTLDLQHHIARATRTSVISKLIPLSGDRVLVCGDFDETSGADNFGAVVLNEDQSIDLTFRASIDFRRVIAVLAKPNGHVLVTVVKSKTDSQGNTSRLIELDEKGSFVGVIPLNFGSNTYSVDGSQPPLADNDTFSVSLLPDDDLLINIANNNSPVPIMSSWVLLNGDASTAAKIRTVDSRELNQVAHLGERRIHSDGVIYQLIGNSAQEPVSLPVGRQLSGIFPDRSLLLDDRRWDPEVGFVDETLPFLSDLQFYNPEFVPAKNGKLFLTSRNFLMRGSPDFLNFSIFVRPAVVLRLHSSLQVDPTFKLNLGEDSHVGGLLPVGETVWVAGDFSEVNGVPRTSLARISDYQVGGFQDWMRATTGVSGSAPVSFDPLADSDQDGLSDFYEYALGSHPTTPSLTDPRMQKLSAMTYRLPCNPDAPEVIRRIEVSTDLKSWRPALASEVRIDTTSSCLTWTLQPGFRHLYCRVSVVD